MATIERAQPITTKNRAAMLAAFCLMSACNDSFRANDSGTGKERSAIINGIPDPTGLATADYGCSAVLIARRTLITAGHCIPQFVTGCQTLAATFPAGRINFPLPDGTVNAATLAARQFNVIGAQVHPRAVANLSGCSTTTTCQTNAVNCADFTSCAGTPNAAINVAGNIVNRANDLTVLYLDREAPADMVPLRVMVDPSVVNQSASFVTFPDILSWADDNQPFVTIVGSGTGTSSYTIAGTVFPGRDAGITQWTQTSFSSYAPRWTSCNTTQAVGTQPALLVTAPDLVMPFPDAGPGSNRTTVPAGYNYPDASSTAAGPGDSGGPVLVGSVGDIYQGRQATPLPIPGPGDTYLLNDRYVAGIAEFNRTDPNPAGVQVASDLYAPTFELTNSQFLAAALADTDFDGIPDGADPFPTCPSNSDDDGDGTCDEEDDCPCDSTQQDPLLTGDRDGICACEVGACGATECAKPSYDNCRDATNPGQENCNLDAEIVLAEPRRGDACDPAPCPVSSAVDLVVRDSIAPVSCTPTTCPFTVTAASGIRWQGVVNPSSQGLNGTTTFAHCLCTGAHATSEQRVANCHLPSAATPLGQCSLGSAGSFPLPGTTPTSSGWRAITTLGSGTPPTLPGLIQIKIPVGPPGLFEPPSSTGTLAAAHPTSRYAPSGSPAQGTRWLFDLDFTRFNMMPPPGGISNVTTQQLEALTTALRGIGWGFTSSFNGAPVTTNGRLRDRASNYFSQDPVMHVRPNFPTRPPISGGPGSLMPGCLTCPPSLPPWVARSRPVGLGPSDVVVVSPDASWIVQPGFDSRVIGLLGRPITEVAFVPPSESTETLAARRVAERGAFLDRTTGVITVVLQDEAGVFSSVEPGFEGSPPVSNSTVSAFGALTGELFLLRPSGSAAPKLAVVNTRTGDFFEVSLSGVSTGVPLSATYRFSDDALYVADRLSSGKLRVLRVARTGAAIELGRVDDPGTRRTDIHLGATPTGSLVLTAAGSEWDTPLYLILDVVGNEVRVIASRYDAKPGRLTAPPIVSRTSGFAVAKATGAVDDDFGELSPADFTPVTSKPLNQVSSLFRARSTFDNCSFQSQSVGNDCVAARSLALFASHHLLVADRATVRGPGTTFTSVANGGTVETNIGVDAQVGNVWSLGPVTVRDRGRVNGFVRGGSSVTIQTGATVTGTILRNVSLNLLPLSQLGAFFPQGAFEDISLEPPPSPNSQRSLAPGPFGNVAVKSNAKLFLRSGAYSFRSLTFEPNATLSLDTSAGPIFVYVETTFRFRGRIVNQSGPRADFLVGVFGTETVFVEAPFVGTIVAPTAGIVLATVTGSHVGSFFGRDIEVRPQTNVLHEPFNYPWVP